MGLANAIGIGVPFYTQGGPSFSGLLDTYSGAVAAYSTRLLRNAYSGALVRIRRSSDSAEKDFYPDSNNELSMSSEDGAGTSLSTWISTDSGYIVTWYDQSTSGNNITNATASTQPRIVNAGTLETKNSLASVYFFQDHLATGSTITALSHSTDHTVCYVCSNEAAATFGTGYNSNQGSTSDMRGLIDRRSQKRGLQTNISYYANLSAQRSTNALRLLIHTQDTSKNMATWDNGVTGGTATYVGTYTNGTMWLGSSTNNPLNGYISEFIIWDSEQDDAGNRTGIETDVNGYFSIY